jgi:nitroreductase
MFGENVVMEFFEVLKLRRSTRAFTDEAVSEYEILKLLEAARLAPSAGNIQPWVFVVVRDADMKGRLAEAALNQSFIKKAPVVIVVCADPDRSRQRYGGRGENLFCVQDSAAAVQNMLLAAVDLGLGACWVGAFREDMVKAALRIPESLRPVAVVPVGRPAEKPSLPYRRPLGEIVRYETF